MKRFVSKRDPNTGEKVKVMIDLTPVEIADRKAAEAAEIALQNSISSDPLQNPLTPPQFHAMVKYIKAQTGTDMDTLIRAGIVASAGGNASSLAALAAIETYERSQQYRYNHPLSTGVAAVMIANGDMTEAQRSAWWLEAAGL